MNHGHDSCTKEVQVTLPFLLGEHRVVLVDTPGFDDDEMSDTDVLAMIATFLEESYVKLMLDSQRTVCFLPPYADSKMVSC